MYIDAKKLKDELTPKDIIKIATFLGAERYEEYENRLVFPTICHNTREAEKSMKLYYYFNSKIFKCFTECDECFDIYGLIKKVFELRGIHYGYYEQIQTVVNILKIDLSNFDSSLDSYESELDKYKKKKKEIYLPKYSENVLASFLKYHPIEWINEGIDEETMEKYKIFYAPSKNKIIIPHYDIDNNLVGIRGRAMNQYEIEKGNKYMPFEVENILYAHPLHFNLYGLNFTKEAIKKSGVAIIFEAEKSVMMMDTVLREENNSVACCGSNLNKIQIELLLKHCNPKEIVIAFDKEYEKNYTDQSNKYYLKLKKIVDKYSNYCNFSFIFDFDNLLKYKDSPIDRGYNIFLKLFENRIK